MTFSLDFQGQILKSRNPGMGCPIDMEWKGCEQGWGQFRNWNWNWYQFQFQFQELELKRNWIKGIGIGIHREELKELIQFLFLIVNSFWFFAMFLAKSLNQFDLKSFWIQLTRISLDRYIILYDIYRGFPQTSLEKFQWFFNDISRQKSPISMIILNVMKWKNTGPHVTHGLLTHLMTTIGCF